jgi:DNA-binding helix-hairpin-helix protein with protein kinase domain
MQSEKEMTVNPDQAIFDAISAAVTHDSDGIIINSKAFIETFNGHRDRKLCTSLDVAQTRSMTDRIKELEEQRDFARAAVVSKCRQYDADMQSMQVALNREIEARGVAQTSGIKIALEAAARIEALEAALREIENMAPATCEVTLAHQMADIASAALAPPSKD